MSGASRPLDPTAQERFDELAAEHLDTSGVTLGRIFHNEGLKANGKLYAMVVRGRLVVKLPARHAATLIASGEAAAFEPRPGRLMKEWVSLAFSTGPGDCDRWRDLMADARSYVAALNQAASPSTRV